MATTFYRPRPRALSEGEQVIIHKSLMSVEPWRRFPTGNTGRLLMVRSRQECGLSPQELADIADITVERLAAIEAGEDRDTTDADLLLRFYSWMRTNN